MIETKEELYLYFRTDLEAQYLGAKWKPHFVFTKRVAYYQRLLRLAEYRQQKATWIGRLIYLVTRLRLQLLSERLGFDIPLNVFGPGLSIAHRGSIVVNGLVRAGRDVRIHQGVTIGAIGGKAPVIGDNVFIGPNAGVYGDIHVGAGARLAPGVVVYCDVPAGAVIHNPASFRRPADLVQRPLVEEGP